MTQPTTNNYFEPPNKNVPLKRWNIFLVVLLIFQCLYLFGQASGLVVDIVGLSSLRLKDDIKGPVIGFEACKGLSLVFILLAIVFEGITLKIHNRFVVWAFLSIGMTM